METNCSDHSSAIILNYLEKRPSCKLFKRRPGGNSADIRAVSKHNNLKSQKCEYTKKVCWSEMVQILFSMQNNNDFESFICNSYFVSFF